MHAFVHAMWKVIAPIVLIAGAARADTPRPPKLQLEITSPAFAPNAEIPGDFTCDGADTSPPLQWRMVPPQAKSLALLVDDPDAPKSTFTHWLVTGISPTSRGVDAGHVPEGATEQANSSGTNGYTPPCPPSGSHRYVFQLFALDTALPATVHTRADLLRAINGHVLAQGKLVGTYTKK
jgi:Raf kinase inhibitor-like YbhB/YbcL family protein